MFDKFKKKPTEEDKLKKKQSSDDSGLAINSLIHEDDMGTPVDDSNTEIPDVEEDGDDIGIIGDLLKNDGHLQNVNNDDKAEDDSVSKDEKSKDIGIETFDIRHIDKLANAGARNEKNKKLAKRIIAIAAIIIVLLVVAQVILTVLKPGEEPIEPIPTNTPEVVDPVIEKDPIISNLTQYGNVKRIMDNKVIIRPDNSLSDTIYFITDKTTSTRLNDLKIDQRIEFSYFIEDSKNVFVDFKNVYTGTIISIGENSIILEDDKENIEEFLYAVSLRDILKQVTSDDQIEYSLNDSGTISSISNVMKADAGQVINGKPDYVDTSGRLQIDLENEFDTSDWAMELASIQSAIPNSDYLSTTESDYENNTASFYNPFEEPIWIRFAWRVNEYTPIVPSVQEVGVSLIDPDGNVINSETISQFGRMWIDGNIINFAIQNPMVGNWKLKADKNIGFQLGDTKFMLMKLSGFIAVEKFGVNNIGDNKLDFIWHLGGVEDEYYSIEISIASDKYTTKLYSANSKTQDLKLIDHVVINAEAIPKGTYDVIVRVQDIDIYTSEDSESVEPHTRKVGAETIIDTYNAGKLIIN